MKRVFLLVILGILLASCSFSPSNSNCGANVTDNPHVFVVTAFKMELAAVMQNVQEESRCTAENGITYYLAKFKNDEIVVYMSGTGNVNATDSTRFTLEHFNVKALIFSGIAGGIDPKLAIGDTVVPQKWYDITTGESVNVDVNLYSIASKLFGDYPAGATSPVFVSDNNVVSNTWTKYGAGVVDMETYQVAKVAYDKKVPFIGIRSVSDYANGQKTKDFYQKAANSSAEHLVIFLEQYLNTP